MVTIKVKHSIELDEFPIPVEKMYCKVCGTDTNRMFGQFGGSMCTICDTIYD